VLEWLLICAATTLGVTVLPLFIVVVYSIVKIHAKATIAIVPRRVETRVEVLSDQMSEFIGRCVEQFREAGFEVLANLQNSDAVTNAQSIHLLLANPATDDTASAVIASTKFTRTFAVSVTSRFADDRRIVTGSRRSVGIMPRDPRHETANFPWVRDARILCEAHRRRLEIAGRASMPRVGPDRQNVIPWLDKQWDEEMRRGVALGYRYVDQSAKLYRYTWKGAVLSTLKLLSVVKRLRACRGESKARLVWKALKMDEYEPADSPAHPPISESRPAPRNPSLQYLVGLAPGEIRRERHDGAYIVRIGGKTPMGVLTRRWLDVVVLISYTALAGLAIWFFFRIWSVLPGIGVSLITRQWAVALLWLAFAVPAVWRITRDLLGCSGTITLTANKAGLQYRNVPHLRDSQVSRDDVHGLMVVRRKQIFAKPVGRLYLRLFDAHKKRLLIPEADVATLVEVRKDLAEAMGIEISAAPSPMPSSSV
jgi:hypothetical protein